MEMISFIVGELTTNPWFLTIVAIGIFLLGYVYGTGYLMNKPKKEKTL